MTTRRRAHIRVSEIDLGRKIQYLATYRGGVAVAAIAPVLGDHRGAFVWHIGGIIHGEPRLWETWDEAKVGDDHRALRGSIERRLKDEEAAHARD